MKKSVARTQPSPLGRGDLQTSLLFIFPLFFLYQVGVLFSSTLNGADFVTRAVFSAVGGDRIAYLAVQLALAIIFFACVLWVRKRRSLTLGDGIPMVLESAIYALTLGSLIIVFMDRVLGLALAFEWASAESQLVGLQLGPTSQAIVASMGAGVYEELVFRLGLLAGIAALLARLGVRMTVAIAVAVFISSVLFSLAHHVGPFGEPLEMRVFIYRALAGLAFAAIFLFRSLAHAVYAHFLYDVYVMVIHS